MTVYKPVRALERGLAVLRAANTLAVPTVEAIARETRLTWSTTYRLLETLELAGYVHRHDSARTFRPTLTARTLSDGYTQDAWIAQSASPEIGQLSRKLIWPVDLMIYAADAMLIVESTHRSSPLSIDRNMIGRRLPILLTSAGRCYLGHLPPKPQKAILQRLELKTDDEGQFARQRDTVEQMLLKVRRDGFGVREGRLFPHTKSIAVPLMSDGVVKAAISVIWIASALTLAEGIGRFLAPLKACAERIERSFAGLRPMADGAGARPKRERPQRARPTPG